MTALFRNHGAAILARLAPSLPVTGSEPWPPEAVTQDDPRPAALTAEAQPVFKHQPYVSPGERQ